MKMCCVKCVAMGMAIGMLAGAVLVQTCPQIKQAVDKGKEKVMQMVDKTKKSNNNQECSCSQPNQQEAQSPNN